MRRYTTLRIPVITFALGSNPCLSFTYKAQKSLILAKKLTYIGACQLDLLAIRNTGIKQLRCPV
jgi:hypothetical protein